MTFLFDERPDSRSITVEPPSMTLRYNAIGEFDETTVLGYALAATPISVFTQIGQLWRQPLSVDSDGWSRYVVTVPYGARKRDTGSVGFSFDATGASIHIKASREKIASFAAPDEEAADLENLINVNLSGAEPEVEGTDVFIPALAMTYDYRYPQGVVDESFARSVAGVVAHTNLNPWRGFEPEELLLVGITGSGSDSEASAQVKVIASQNADSLTIGEIAGIVKKGHHYASLIMKNSVKAGVPIKKVQQVDIHRIYDPIDFASVLGFS